MDGNITKALWLGVGILFFVVVVSLGLFMLNQGQDMVNAQSDNISESEKALNDSKYSAYDNETVSGSMVLNLIKEHQDKSGSFVIQVTTLKSSNVQYISTGTVSADFVVSGLTSVAMATVKSGIKNAKTETHNNYISPVAKFYAQVAKDANGHIRAVLVTQN
jgi:uncharacterized membrane protein